MTLGHRTSRWLGSLSTRITVVILGLITVFSLTTMAFSYFLTTSWLETTALENLSALATARQHAVEAQLDRYRDVMRAFVIPELETEVPLFLSSQGGERERFETQVVSEMERHLNASDRMVAAQLLDPEGDLVLGTARGLEPMTDPNSLFFQDALLNPSISDPFFSEGQPRIHLGTPIRDGLRDVVAVLVLEKRADPLLAITGDYSGLGDTGETVLGARGDDEVRFLVPLRFAPDPTLIESVPVTGRLAAPMIHATAGQAGWTRDQDYRGEPVVAAYRPLTQAGWGLVAKMDEAEIFGPVADIRSRLLLVLGLLLAGAAAVLFPLVRTFLAPVRQLEQATRRIAEGDLTVEVPIHGEDEIGDLAHSFNRMVEHVRNAREDLTRRNEELDAFAHVVSHDLKAPLRGISGLAGWVKEDLGDRLDADPRRYLELMSDQVVRMDEMIEGLLEYSRVGRLGYPTAGVDLETLVREEAGTLEANEGLELRIVGPLPTIDAQEIPLRVVLRNLIENAVKHHSGPRPTIEISCTDQGDAYEIVVADDGPGIDPLHHKRIFGIFRKTTHGDDRPGIGLGLALVKKAVEEGGGRIWVESDPSRGPGTTFRVLWPKREPNNG